MSVAHKPVEGLYPKSRSDEVKDWDERIAKDCEGLQMLYSSAKPFVDQGQLEDSETIDYGF